MRRKGFKKIFKHVTALVIAVAMLAGGTGGGSNPTVASAATLSHEKATEADVVNGNRSNSKGIQGTNFADDSFGDSVANLNLNHLMLNVDLADIIAKTGTGTSYEYHGKTYYFNEGEGSQMKALLLDVEKYRKEGITWTFCLVMHYNNKVNDPKSSYYNPELNKLMYHPEPDYNKDGAKVYYALNSIGDQEAQEWISAIFHYMAEKFGYSDTFVQNWRVGNEVNVSHDYNYTGAEGSSMKDTLVGLATASYNLLDQALQDVNPNARAYVSVTHDWNNSNEGTGIPTKDFIDAFAADVKDSDWNLDFHAYPPQMYTFVWDKASVEYLTHKESTKFICGPNLEVLTDYIKEHFGSNHRVILSEQSYVSNIKDKAGNIIGVCEAEQAAMIAQTYYAGADNDMVDAIIFTTYNDTNTRYHDNYDMGIVDQNGNKKESYSVFQYMNTDQASVYTDPYLSKLSEWTGRQISSWTDKKILYQAQPTDAVLTNADLCVPPAEEYGSRDPNQVVWMSMASNLYGTDVDLIYRWTAYNKTTGKTEVIGDDILGQAAIEWYPKENAVYEITCTVSVPGNPASPSITKSVEITVNMPGLPSSVPPVQLPRYELGDGTGKWDGTYYRLLDGTVVTNAWFFDGDYTYFLMANGTPMKDQLTYHPDGIHVIYFDKDGHEVFNNFTYVGKNIADMVTGIATELNEYCYFDGNGYQYTDVVTWGNNDDPERAGKLYYANTRGILERNGWFTFSENAKYAGDGTLWPGAGKRGFANSLDRSLMRETWTYDENDLYRYMNGYGVLE